MVKNDPSFRLNEESYNALLNHRFDRNATAKQRRRDNNSHDGYSSIATSFLQEEVQPTTRRNDIPRRTSNGVDRRCSRGHGQANFSTVGPKKRCFPRLVSEFIQQYTVQPPRVTNIEDNTRDIVFDSSENKKRPRSSDSYSQTETTMTGEPKIELRIEGETMNDIIDKIRTKTFSTCAHESSSIFLKGIRRLSTSTTDLRRENEIKESLLLLKALKDLVKNRGSAWKRIRIQDCAPWIVEVLLASPYCNNFEVLHMVGMCNDEQYPPKHSQLILTQAESSSESQLPSFTTTSYTQTEISSLIISLLRKTSRIKELVLQNCNLDNFELNRIMNILCAHPNHRESLELLDLRFNKFTPIAIQSILAIYLRSSLHSLKTLKIRQGLRCVVHRNIRDAILQSLRCNRVVLESIDIFDWDKSVQYLLDINRANRRFIFCNNDRFPRTLWPLLLEKALVANEKEDCDELITKTKSLSLPSLFVPRRRNTSSTRRQASVVYHIFRNGGPMLLQQHHSSKQSIGIESN